MKVETLVEYDQWANNRVYDELRKLPQNEYREEAQKLFAHILGAQSVWYNRIIKSGLSLKVWPDYSELEIEQLLHENPQKLKSLISKKEERIVYSNSSGRKFENTVDEILMHLIVHGQHHRAQIATLIRKSGSTPPATDLIFFLRKD